MNFLSPVFALLLVLASSAAWAQAPAPAAAAKDEVKAGANLPKQDLTGQILYQFLLAEIAAQRGQLGFSCGRLLDLAKQHTRSAHRAPRDRDRLPCAPVRDRPGRRKLWLSLEPDSPQARQMQSTLLLSSGRIDELAGSLARDLARIRPAPGEALMRLHARFHPLSGQAGDTAPVRPADPAVSRACRSPLSCGRRRRLGIGDTGRAAARSTRRWLCVRTGTGGPVQGGTPAQGRGPARVSENLAGSQSGRPGCAPGLCPERWSAKSATRTRESSSAACSQPIPDNPDMLYAVGILSLQVNDASEAEQQLKRYVELGRGDVNPARFYLGQIAEQAKRLDEPSLV
jgi:hypothetical protein